MASVPSRFVDEEVVADLSSPTAMAFAPDGRIFVCEQGGSLRIIKAGKLLPTPFVSVTVDPQGERGLLGVAFDPDFANRPYVYLYYTATTPKLHNRVSRFTVSKSDANLSLPSSEAIVLDLDPLSNASNHNGGALHFGKDDMLYIGVGENATETNSQNLNNLLGKLLRVKRDGTIPSDNPFSSRTTGINRAIWAIGLRNPFTFSVHPATGRIFIHDVGQYTWEEINEATPGANYGWPSSEGKTEVTKYQSPYFTYNHNEGCAITGGTFYDPPKAQFPEVYRGAYFFMDYCTGWIHALDTASKTVSDFATGLSSPVDLETGPDGALYYLNRGTSSLRRIVYTESQAPVISRQPQDTLVAKGEAASFSVTVSGKKPIAYQWQRDGKEIEGATDSIYAIAVTQLSDSGSEFRVGATNSDGTVLSAPARLRVTTNNAPVVLITEPASEDTYAGGKTIAYAATATDPEDGTLPPSAFTWEIVFHHQIHTHPFLGPIKGKASGEFTIPDRGENSAEVWYRIHVTVTDSKGMQTSTFCDIYPDTVGITLDTDPQGLPLRLDGQPIATPYHFTAVVGLIRKIGAPATAKQNDSNWTFATWSDNGDSLHEITVAESDTNLTATYQVDTTPEPTILEAESAFRSGVKIRTAQSGYTGTGYLTYSVISGGYTEWRFEMDTAGTYPVKMRYMNTAKGNRFLRITVNGKVFIKSQIFAGSNGVETWNELTLDLPLNAGSNRVRALSMGKNTPLLDHLELP